MAIMKTNNSGDNSNDCKTIIQYNPRFYPIMGGGEVYVANIIQNSPQYKFIVIANGLHKQPKIENYFENTIIVRQQPVDWNLSQLPSKKYIKPPYPYKILSDIIRLQKKYSAIKKINYDLLHIHGIGFESNFLKTDSRIKKLMFSKLINFKFVESPKLLTVHNLFSPSTNNKIYGEYEHHIIDQFDNIIAVDSNIYTYVKNYTEDTNQDKKIWFVPNSVDTDLFSYKEYNESNTLKVGFVGRLESSRGLEHLYSLIANVPQGVEISVVGAGNEKSINSFKAKVNTSKIKLYTNLKNSEIPHFLNDIDVLFNPVTVEGISRITLEAMSCGKVVIMLDKGNRYPIVHDKTGYLFKDINELCILLECLQTNPFKIKKIGDNARKIVVNEFSNKVIVAKINKIYDQIME